jgi:hypothetical protein
MANNPLTLRARLSRCLRARGIAFWAVIVTVLSVGTLFVGSQIAHDRGQSADWYTGFGQWLGALGSFIAAGTALWIATRDRKARSAERHDEEKTQARLLQLTVESGESNRAAITIDVRNFGPLPVLDVEIVEAKWSEHPEARWVMLQSHWGARGIPADSKSRPILKPSRGLEDTYDTLVNFVICFWHPSEDRPLAAFVPRTAGYPVPSYVETDPSTIVAKIHFTTANGVRWETPTKGTGADAPVRLSPQ